MKKIYVIDGSHFSTLEEFFDEFSRVVLQDLDWGRNLDAFNDVLRGGFGTPEDGFILRWQNSKTSRQKLGYPETVRQLHLGLEKCHPTNRSYAARQITDAEESVGATVFDWIVEIIRNHGAGGTEAEDGVELELS